MAAKKMRQPKTVAIIGAGDRGRGFANLIREYGFLIADM